MNFYAQKKKLNNVELRLKQFSESMNVSYNISRVKCNYLFEIHSTLNNIVKYKHSMKLQDKYYTINPEKKHLNFLENFTEDDKNQLIYNIEKSICNEYIHSNEFNYNDNIKKISPIIITQLKKNYPNLSRLICFKKKYNNIDNMFLINKNLYYTILNQLYYDIVILETTNILKDKGYDKEYLVNILENNKHILYLYEILLYYRKISLFEMRFNLKNKKFINNKKNLKNKRFDEIISENTSMYFHGSITKQYLGSSKNKDYLDEKKPTVRYNVTNKNINTIWHEAALRFISSDSKYQTAYMLEKIKELENKNQENLLRMKCMEAHYNIKNTQKLLDEKAIEEGAMEKVQHHDNDATMMEALEVLENASALPAEEQAAALAALAMMSPNEGAAVISAMFPEELLAVIGAMPTEEKVATLAAMIVAMPPEEKATALAAMLTGEAATTMRDVDEEVAWKGDDEGARRDEEAARAAEKEAARREQEAARREQEEAVKKAEEEVAAWKAAEEKEAARREQEEAVKKAEEEVAARKAAEEAARKEKEIDAEKQKKEIEAVEEKKQKKFSYFNFLNIFDGLFTICRN